jgi:hypothetical protein
MIKSAEIAGPSCLTRAADDEPLFVLRAHDELAPDIVRAWAERYRAHKAKTAPLTDREYRKYLEALSLAETMDAWRTAHPS